MRFIAFNEAKVRKIQDIFLGDCLFPNIDVNYLSPRLVGT